MKYDFESIIDRKGLDALAVDELGNEIDGDFIMAILALDMKKKGTLI